MDINKVKSSALASRFLEPELPGARVFGWSRSRHFGPALNICLIIHENYMEHNII